MNQPANQQVSDFSKKIENISYEVRKVLVGQDDLLVSLLIGLLAEGHVLLEGAPGLAKTLAVKTFATSLGLPFKRIQFTPDLLPSDVVGTEIYNQSKSTFTTNPGPIFASIILADEINRAPAKVQSALLEAMQERQVTIGKNSFRLPQPFMVMATQNPIEQEGTYPLPEAQIDRFLMKVNVDYPSPADEETILQRVVIAKPEKITNVITQEEVMAMIESTKSVYIDPKITEFIVAINTKTRMLSQFKELEDLSRYVEYGCSPRGTIALAQVSRARAILSGRTYVTPEDVVASVNSTLKHRIILSYEALAEGVTQAYILERILETIKAPTVSDFKYKVEKAPQPVTQNYSYSPQTQSPISSQDSNEPVPQPQNAQSNMQAQTPQQPQAETEAVISDLPQLQNGGTSFTETK
jgi:MoxR-like ATPase